MNDLSIVMAIDGEEAEKSAEMLAPLFDEFDLELLVISNKETVNLRFPYKIYQFREDPRGFLNFCLNTSLADKIMIIPAGWQLVPDLFGQITKYLRRKDYRNLSCGVKSYLAEDKSKYYVHDEVLIYTRGVWGFNESCHCEIEDISFLNVDEKSITVGITRLLDTEHYCELADWYQSFIQEKTRPIRERFLTILERQKALSISPDASRKLDSLFIQLCKDSRYKKYLNLKKQLAVGGGRPERFHPTIRLRHPPAYICWLLRPLLKEYRSLELLSRFSEKTLRYALGQLLCQDGEAPQYLYDYIENASESVTGAVFPALFDAYINFQKDRSDSPDLKKRLLFVCNLYLETFSAEKSKKGAADLMEFLDAIQKAKKLETAGRFGAAVALLDLASGHLSEYRKPLRYYIQKIRYAHRLYSHVLSICMIVKDEEKNLERCLKSLLPLMRSGMAELIVVDTGSQDKTLEIASQYTNKIFSHPWNGDFSEARNESILYADGEYIFILDADEEFRPSDLEALIQNFSAEDYRDAKTFSIRLVSFTAQDLKQYSIMMQPRIFQNDGMFYYSSAVHNQPVSEQPLAALNIELLHYGYIMTRQIREAKFQRTATLLRQELQRNPGHIYYRFQLSASYAMYGDLKEARKQVDLYMRLLGAEALPNDIVLMYYNNAAIIYTECQQYDEALKICDLGLKAQPDYIDFLYCKGYICFLREEYQEAMACFLNYLRLIEAFYTHEIAEDGRFAFYSISGKEYVKKWYVAAGYRLRRFEDVISMASRFTEPVLFKDSFHEISGAYFKTGRFHDLQVLLESGAARCPDAGMEYVFRHFLLARFHELDKTAQKDCLSSFDPAFREKYLETAALSRPDYPLFSFDLIGKYDLNGVDYESLYSFLAESIPAVLSFSVSDCSNPAELGNQKTLAALLLRWVKELLLSCASSEDLAKVFNKYMEISAKLVAMKQQDLLEAKERLFIGKMLMAFEYLKTGDTKKAAECMEDSTLHYSEMHDFVNFAVDSLIPKETVTENSGNGGARDDVGSSALQLQIAGLSASTSPESVLKLCGEAGSRGACDAEFYRIQSAALMAADRTEEAASTLSHALEQYPDDPGLQRNLYYASLLKKDYPAAQQAYSRLKIENPRNKSVPLFPCLTAHSRGDGQNSTRVLQGTLDLSSQTAFQADVLKRKGIYSRSLNYAPEINAEFKSDYALDVSRLKTRDDILHTTRDITSKIIPQFDVFHFHHGYTLTFDHFDLLALRDLGKKVFMNYWGRDVRPTSKVPCGYKRGNREKDCDESILRRLESLSALIPECIVCDEEVYEYVRDFFQSVHIIRPMIDLERYKPAYKSKRGGRLTILHACPPGMAEESKQIGASIEAIQENYPINYRIVQGIPHEKAMELYREADLIIDQIRPGSYGKLAIEAMALGKPVICGISDFMQENYPSELPILRASPDTLRQTVEYVLNNRELLFELGKKGRSYVEKYHDSSREAEKLIKLYGC